MARTITHDGLTLTLDAWAERIGITGSALRQRLHLDLDKAGLGRGLAHPLQHRAHATCGGDVVFLDQHRVVQANAVVHPTTDLDRVFLRQPQARQGFSGVHNGRAGAAHRIHITRGFGRHRAEQLQKIERGAFGGQQRLGAALDLQHHLVGVAGVALGHVPMQHSARVAGTHRGVDPRPAAHHSALARQDAGVGAAAGIDQGGGQVAAAHVFGQGSGHIGLRQGGEVGVGVIAQVFHGQEAYPRVSGAPRQVNPFGL